MNPLKSNTVLGAIMAVLMWLLSPQVLDTIHNATIAAVLQGIGIIWSVIGARRAVAKAALGQPK